MKRILISLAAVVTWSLAYASAPVNFPITCANNVSISATSTLKEVQSCIIVKQESSKGLYVVEFKDNNGTKYSCKFTNNQPTTTISTNSCTK